MNDWQKRFARRIQNLHDRASADFGKHVQHEIEPAWQGMATFLESGGVHCTPIKPAPGLHGVLFHVSDGVGVELIFSMKGPFEVEAATRLRNPYRKTSDDRNVLSIAALADASEGWARQQIERSVDLLLDTVERLLDPNAMLLSDQQPGSPDAEHEPANTAPRPTSDPALAEGQPSLDNANHNFDSLSIDAADSSERMTA